jgi:hypothetical protein
MGVNVGDTDPFVSNEPTNGGEGEGMGQAAINAMVASLIPGWGGPTCKVDGMATGCRLAFGLLASGGGVLAPSNAQSGVFTRFTNKTNGQVTTRWSPLTAIDTGRGTWFGYLPMGAQLGVDGHPDIFEINLAEIAAPGSRNMTYVGMLRELSSYAMHDVWLQRVSIFKAINEIEDALKNKTCASFMNGVLAELGKTYGRGRGLSFEDLFHSIPVSAFHADPKSGSIASASPDGIMIGHPEFKITIRNLFSGAAAAVLMHEITHGSPTEGNNYTHYQMADAAYTVAGSMGLLDNKLGNFGLKGVTANPNESLAKTPFEAKTINNSNSGLFTGLIMKPAK